MKLHELCDELDELMTEIELNDGEVPEDMDARIDALNLALDTKVENVAALSRNLEAHADTLTIEAQRLQRRADVRKRAATRLRGYLHRCLMAAGLRKLEGMRFTVALRKTPARVVLDVPETSIPERWWREKTTRSLDRKGLGDALKAGEDVDGVAHLETGERLEVRT